MPVVLVITTRCALNGYEYSITTLWVEARTTNPPFIPCKQKPPPQHYPGFLDHMSLYRHWINANASIQGLGNGIAL